MTAEWNQLFNDPVNIIRDPDPLVRNFAEAANKSGFVLDFGCGGGRHLVYLTKAGFKVTGVDVSKNGLNSSKDWLKSEGLKADLVQLEMSDLPLRDSSISGAISINVLQHALLRKCKTIVQGIRWVLKPGSPFFFVIIGREDARYGEGDEIEPHTFVHHEGIEAGVVHHYYNRTDLEFLLQNYSNYEIEERRRPYDDSHPVFGKDPRLINRDNAVLQHWIVKAWR
ncbi:hypothetical protein CEE37_06285 [candidate division LCP-89 bacterium B3_LCP]|uniref:Methyltransferase domain-containing protein n=1 Tax=candidate division LCP-89 bacterium B3_LCP TaxID=2012998 RepID=A0A532V2B4_UNCL8|nr:MAG: hypothetical protein CEE37_06285 [candidate division LCP-89 bacterium B3_LCP]